VARDTIVENMQEGVIVLDTQNQVVDLNPSAKSIIQIKDSELIGQNVENMLAGFSPDIKDHINTKETKIEIVTAKGKQNHFYDLNLTPLYDRKNNFTGKIIVLRDTTESKRSRAELEEAKEKAEIASRSKSEFLANMSHELRTPLNHIMGFTELVLEEHFGILNEIQQEYLQDVIQSSNHLLSLINDILDLSKIEAGKLALETSEFCPAVLFENSLVILKEKAMKHGLTMATDIGKLPETIAADERKLKQILYNLLSNAVKFTPDGGSVLLGARHYVLSGGRFWSPDDREFIPPGNNGQILNSASGIVEIRVTDSGIGLKKQDLERIFNPFDQVENVIQKKQPGTGLGLSLTRKLVELHGGLVWAESDGENKGSTFRFVIPVSASPS
jgi:PAS domain S-box-containing protein